MKPRFLADADFNQKIVLSLLRREPTIDFQTASQGHVIGRPDLEVLAIAARENRILISHDCGTMQARLKGKFSNELSSARLWRVAPASCLAGPLRSQNRPRVGRGDRDVVRVRGAHT